MITGPASGDDVVASVVVDTGPLLCFGHIPSGLRILRDRYVPALRWTKAVADELSNHARRPPTDSRAAAAQQWAKVHKSYLGPPYYFTNPAVVDSVQQIVKSKSTKPATNNSRDLGESETIALARMQSGVALINEDAGRLAATHLGVKSYCALDVLITEFQEGRLAYGKLKSMYEQMNAHEIDSGEVLPSLMALKRGRWHSYAPRAARSGETN